MSERSFYEKSAKQEATDAIKEIEAVTAAEVVVTLRGISGNYRAADYLVGFVLAIVTLLLLLFLPMPFPLWSFPINVVLGFVIGAVLSSYLPFLRRLLVGDKQKGEAVKRAARAAFVDLGVHRCSGRWGILVFIATFERTVEVVADLSIDTGDVAFAAAVRAMQDAVARVDRPAFVTALKSLGPALAKMHPHRDDDVNELPDEVGDDGEVAPA
jgi:putative membrane protein